MPQKICSRCGLAKDLGEFHRTKKSADGHRTVCKACRSEQKKSPDGRRQAAASYQRNKTAVKAKSRAYYEAHQESCKARQRAYNAAHTEQIGAANKANYQAHRDEILAQRKAWRAANKAKVSAWNRRSREKNIDALRAANKQYVATHREEKNAYERARRVAKPEWEKAKRHNRRASKRAGGTYTPQEWTLLCDFYGKACLACGDPEAKLTPDHVIPLCAGGSNTIENIQPLCLKCNMHKHRLSTDYRRVLPEWFREQPKADQPTRSP